MLMKYSLGLQSTKRRPCEEAPFGFGSLLRKTGVLFLFHLRAVLAACSLKPRHTALNTWLHEECTLLELTKNTRALILFLEAAQCAVD